MGFAILFEVFKEVAERTASGRLFHTRAAATCSVAEGAVSCTCHDQLVGGWWSQTLSDSEVVVGDLL